MTRFSHLLAVLLVAVASSLATAQVNSDSIVKNSGKPLNVSISGEHTLLITKLPFTISVDEGFAYYDWEVSSPVVKSESINSITIKEAKDGDYVVSLKALSIDFENKKTEISEVSVSFRLQTGKNPDPVKPDPPESDFAKLSSMAKTQAEKVGDPSTAAKLASSYRIAINVVRAEKLTLSSAKDLIKNTTANTLRHRDNFDHDWEPAINAIAKQLADLGGGESLDNYLAGVEAIAKGLEDSQ